MIRILLVDDEFLVCSFLKQLINWEGYGFQIVGQASNGNLAMDKIEQLSPDLILLDVNMPELDGIGLIRWLQKTHPDIHVVMLSSYSDYEYVREAMKLGAVDYLLKHELNAEILLKLLNSMDFSEKSQLKQNTVSSDDTAYLLRDSRIRAFFEGRHARAPESLIHLRWPVPVAATLRLSVVCMDGDQGLLQTSHLIRQILVTCVEIIARRGETKMIYLGGSRLIFLYGALPGEDEATQQKRVERNLLVIRDALLKYHNTYIVWNKGNRCSEPSMLPREYDRLLDLKKADHGDKSASGRLTIDQERRLIVAALGKDRKEALRLLDNIFDPMHKETGSGGELEILAGDLLSLIVKLYQENDLTFGDAEKHRVVGADPVQLQHYYTQLLITLIDALDGKERFSRPVMEVLAYVDSHYQQDISLPDIGLQLGRNPSYLSTLFKRETGIGVAQYINRVRVYAAGKRMLMESISPTKVYDQVGFRSYNHFFNLFKEITGYTPKDFHKQADAEWIASFHPLRPKNESNT